MKHVTLFSAKKANERGQERVEEKNQSKISTFYPILSVVAKNKRITYPTTC